MGYILKQPAIRHDGAHREAPDARPLPLHFSVYAAWRTRTFSLRASSRRPRVPASPAKPIRPIQPQLLLRCTGSLLAGLLGSFEVARSGFWAKLIVALKTIKANKDRTFFMCSL